MKEGYIKATGLQLQISPQDRLLRFEQEATMVVRRVPTTKKGPLSSKDLLHIKEKAEKELEEETEAIESRGFVSIIPPLIFDAAKSFFMEDRKKLQKTLHSRLDHPRLVIHNLV